MHVLIELYIDFRHEGEEVLELEILLVVEVKFFYIYGYRLSEDCEFVVADIAYDSVVYYVVDSIGCGLLAESFLNHACGYMTFAESGDIGVAGDFLKFFLYFGLVVVFFNRHIEHGAHVVGLVKCDVHFVDDIFYCDYSCSGVICLRNPRLIDGKDTHGCQTIPAQI